MVALGMDTGSVATALDLEEGLAFLDRRFDGRGRVVRS
jgi:rsbT antagonist protein RsbS